MDGLLRRRSHGRAGMVEYQEETDRWSAAEKCPTGRRGAKRRIEAGPCLGCQENHFLCSCGTDVERKGWKIMKVHLGAP